MSLFARRVSRRFSATANGGETDELAHEVSADATVERVDVRFYRGPQLDLEVFPFVETEDGRRIALVDLVGRDVIVGDNDAFSFSVAEQVREGDLIGVEYTNNDPSHAYTVTVDMVIERAGGLDRLREVL